MIKFRLIAPLAALLAAGLVASCGGGSGGTGKAVDPLAPQAVVDLVAANFGYTGGGGDAGGDAGGDSGAGGGAGDGSPIRKAVIIVTDATGKSVSGLTDDNGNYFVKFTGFTSPLVAKVIDAGGNVLTSVTDERAVAGKAVRMMINPLTDKIVSDTVVSNTVPGTDKNFDGSKIDLTKLAQAKQDVLTSINAALISVGVTSSAFDPIKSSYSYDGTGVDAVIESISHTRDAGTGATLLRAKLVNVDNPTALVTASTPLATDKIATAGSPGLTYDKLQTWLTHVNLCLSRTEAQNLAAGDCEDQIVSANYKSSSKDFPEDFRTLFSNSDGSPIVSSTLRNPVLLFTGKYPDSTAAYDDLAVVEATVRQPSTGPLAGSLANPIEYVKYLIFRRDDGLTASKAGNWILHGNQRNYDFTVQSRYHRLTQTNPAKTANVANSYPSYIRSSIDFSISTQRFNSGTQSYEPANIRAVRVKGVGLPAAGLVLTPTSVAGQTRLGIHNQTGFVDVAAMTTQLAQADFRLNAVALDGSALAASTIIPGSVGTPGVSGGQAWAFPQVTDFSAIQAYTPYTFEIFLNSNLGNATPDAVESSRILSPLMAPTAALSIPMNDLSPSDPVVLAPQPASDSLTVTWANNLNAAPVASTTVYAEERNPKGAATGYSVNKWNYTSQVAAAYSVNNRPTFNTVSTGAATDFPSLINSAGNGDYREAGIYAWQGRARVHNVRAWLN